MPTELIEPSDDEILQVEEYTQAIPVCIDTPVNTREMPSKFAGMNTVYGVTTSLAVRILFKDPKRKMATINALDQDIILGATQAQAQSGRGSGMRWPANVPFVITAYDEVWAVSYQSTTDISVAIETWAE